ncbi:MAG: ABC transporter ATP-binding protein [Lachnospiraceae bacterium]|jgi:ABC-2 type transport system ATP-binding protein|nr:ABC transporter ATP-binding protein [Lachnospiraceae bacterium]
MKIEVAGIKKAYSRKKVLTDISFSMDAGSCAAILGSNGSGKSTLLSILAGVRKADSGAFYVYGCPSREQGKNCPEPMQGTDLLREPGQIPKVLGYVPQGDPLMEELSAWDNLRMWYDRKTLERELSGGALKMLGIDSFLKTPVRRMSGGMKKRLSIGCAVVSHPGILVLDEPSAALDPVCKENIRSYLNVYRKEGGIVLVATHDAQDLELCDMCYILRDGTLHRWQYGGDFHKLAEELCEKNF